MQTRELLARFSLSVRAGDFLPHCIIPGAPREYFNQII
jgi:hypothetical protein